MALVCGTKRSYLLEDETQSIPLSKKPRCSSPPRKTPTIDPNLNQTDSTHQASPPQTGSEWVDLLVKEMMGAASLDDAKSRAGRVLEMLEKEIKGRAREETLKRVGEEKERVMEVLSKENGVLKKAVAIQHERNKEMEEKERELKRLVCGYEEKLRIVEVNNYALSMHLNQALKGDSMSGFYNRDVF